MLSWLDSISPSAVQMPAYPSQVAPLASVKLMSPDPEGSTWISQRSFLPLTRLAFVTVPPMVVPTLLMGGVEFRRSDDAEIACGSLSGFWKLAVIVLC